MKRAEVKPGMSSQQRALRGWFQRNRRAMPWRVTRDPYRIWISEVMLQQTRVAAALPYYRRFLKRFPNVRALARARTEEVLRLWAGLGYYSRARNLHRAAKVIVARHGGRFPREYEAALALPGIGRYTAAAVLSMAYGAPLAVLDGNVARVLARLDVVRGDLRAPKRWRRLQARAQELLDVAGPGDWNQAMMELGATVCTPRRPRCGECPLARWCEAQRRGIAEQVPAPRKKRAVVQVKIAAAVLLDARGRTLLVRQNGGLFSGMWQFPAVEVKRDARNELAGYLRTLCQNGRERPTQRRRERRDNAEKWEALPSARHSVTFREVTLLPHLVRVRELPTVEGARVAQLARIERLPISSATRKIALAARMQRG
jgi:A/G-specific adenine glycosylase